MAHWNLRHHETLEQGILLYAICYLTFDWESFSEEAGAMGESMGLRKCGLEFLSLLDLRPLPQVIISVFSWLSAEITNQLLL